MVRRAIVAADLCTARAGGAADPYLSLGARLRSYRHRKAVRRSEAGRAASMTPAQELTHAARLFRSHLHGACRVRFRRYRAGVTRTTSLTLHARIVVAAAAFAGSTGTCSSRSGPRRSSSPSRLLPFSLPASHSHPHSLMLSVPMNIRAQSRRRPSRVLPRALSRVQGQCQDRKRQG